MGIDRSVQILGLILLAGGLSTLHGEPINSGGLNAEEAEFFESKIRPVLAESCYECHNSVDKAKGDLALDWKQPLLESGVIVPGKPEESDLIRAITHAEGLEPMPDNAPKLSKVTIKQFEEWIRMGAPDPRMTKPTKEDLDAQVDWPTVRDKRAEWWSFQPIQKVSPPPSTDKEWNGSAIDRYIHAEMIREKLTPQPKADPATLVRRLHLIITGLPPRPEVVKQFVADPSEEAYTAMVDHLLSSPQFGERWARHWMDWYRYAETHGSEGDPAIPYAGVYRDYLIRALNQDTPYDQLIREHLAGDLLPKPRIDEKLGLNESAIGPAQLRMVPHGFGVTNAYDEQITFTDNQIDVVSKAMLGLTVSCARCHNHKFDPISQKDFYRLYSIMVSSRPVVRNVDAPARQGTNRSDIESVKTSVRKALASHWLDGIEEAIQRLEKTEFKDVSDTDPFSAWAKSLKQPAKNLPDLLNGEAMAHQERLAYNDKQRKDATFYLDLRDPESADKWFGVGNGSSGEISQAGAFALAPEGEKALTGIYPAGIYSHLVSEKHSATLNTIFHQAKGQHNAVRGIGQEAGARFAMRSYPLSQGLLHPSANFGDRIGWKTIGKYDYWNGEKGYHQIATAQDRTFRTGGKRSWYGLMEIYSGNNIPKETGAPLAAWHPKVESITTRDELLQAYRSGLRRALESWQIDDIDDDHALLLDAALRHGILKHNIADLPENLRMLVNRYRELEAEIPVPTRVAGVMDAEIWNQALLDRGDPRQEGEPVGRGFLELFRGDDYPPDTSGRLDLAEDILREDNPLTSRVIANRLWHHVFGTGLVPTTDNFGRLGKQPSHPELLDHLALSLQSSGWSLKGSIREMVMSRTFRSASTTSEQAREKDPTNRLLSHYPPRRMEAEAIHDTLHFVADAKIEKRAVHERVVRNSLNPFLTTFNFPIPTTTTGSRDLTNVPGQALTLLNGPIANHSAERWANRINADASLDTNIKKITRMYEEAYSRPPEAVEMQACVTFLSDDPENDDAGLLARQDKVRKEIDNLGTQREALLSPIRKSLGGEKRPSPPDLKPVAEWDFTAAPVDLSGKLLGKARIAEGALVLDGGCFLSEPLPEDLHEKTLEVVIDLAGLDQRGGGALTIQDLEGNVFDSIVLGERRAGEWMAGSDHFNRTSDFGGKPETEAVTSPVHLALVLGRDGSTRLFRNGEPYGQPYNNDKHVSYKAGQCQIAIGLRHGQGPGGGRVLRGRVYNARIHNRALTPDEIAAASAASVDTLTMKTIRAAMTGPQQKQLTDLESRQSILQKELDDLREKLGNPGKHDAWTRLAHALINTKEFIYVR